MLTFLAPLWWWLAVPVVAWIAWLHTRRRRRLVVASASGWERTGAVPTAARRHLRPVPSWPLALQLAAALAAIAVLAGPRFGAPTSAGVERVVLVVGVDDVDAVRAAVAEGGPARPAPDVRVTVLDARSGGLPLVADAAVGVAARALGAAWQANASPPDWPAAAAAVARLGATGAQVVVLARPDATAAATEAFDDVDVAGVRVVAAGPAGPSVAIERAVLRRDPDGPRLEVDARVRVDTVPSLAIEARAGGTVLGRATVAAPERGRVGRELLLDDVDVAGEVEVVVRVPADGPVVASVWRADPAATQGEPLRVAVLGEADARLRAYLDAAGVATVAVADPTDVDADLAIVVGVPLAVAPATHTLWLGAAPPGVPAEVVPGPWSVRFGAHDPLFPAAAAHAVQVPELLAVPRLPGADVLAWADGWPAVQARVVDGRAEVVAGLPSAAEAWTDDDALYVLLGRLLRWLDPTAAPAGAVPCRVGVPCALPARPTVGAWSVSAPSGTRVAPGLAWTDGPGATAWDPWFVPSEPGWHEAAAGERVWTVWVDPVPDPPAGTMAPEGGAAAAARSRLPVGLGRLVAVVALATALASAWGAAGRTRWRAWRLGRRSLLVVLASVVAGAGVLAVVGGPWPTGWVVPRTVVVGAEVPDGSVWGDAYAAWSDDLAIVGERVDVPARDPEAALRTDGAASPRPTADLAAALAWARAWLADAPVGRVVVPLQGLDVGAPVARPLEAIAARAELAVVQLPRFRSPEEVVVHGAWLLGDLGAGGTVRVVLDVEPATDRALRLSVEQDGEPWFETDLDLVAGRSTLSVDAPVAVDAEARYTFALEDAAAGVPVAGTAPRADGVPTAWAGAVVPAAPRPRVAVVSDEVAWPLLFVQLLEVQGFAVTLMDPSDAPTRADGWVGFDVVALFDLPATTLVTAQQTALEAWVAEFGGGLMLLGGPRAFGPGGYHLTRLDALSPLAAAVPMDRPDVAVVFVLDRSGSMLQPVGPSNRLEIAREATWEAVQLLDPRSQVGIVVFDSSATLVQPVRPVADLDAVRGSLDLLRAGGGTNLQPALEMAHAALAPHDEVQRHVVVMTDGLTMGADFDPVMAAFVADGITVSTIAVGQGAAYPRLELIARETGGVFHESIDFELLPSIMAQEVLLLTADVVRREPSAVAFEPEVEFLAGITRTWPDVGGVVRTTARPEATVHASLADGTPLLASWRYGAGQVVAWSSEAVGDWTFDWLTEPAFPLFWGQVARWSGARAAHPGLRPVAFADGAEAVVEVVALDARGAPRSGVEVTTRWRGSGPDGSEREAVVAAREVAAGTYAARVGGFVGPVHVVASASFGDGDRAEAATATFVAATPAPPGDPLQVRALASAVGASYGDVGDLGLPAVERLWLWDPIDAWRPWLVLALLSWAAVLGFRYR